MLQHNGSVDVVTLFLAVILNVIFLLLVVGIKSIAINQALVALALVRTLVSSKRLVICSVRSVAKLDIC